MNLKQIEAFVQIAHGKSFSKAARELYLTQPTISAHIASLEKELNARLFIRNTKEVSLSEDGKLLYEYAIKMLHVQSEIEEIFRKRENSQISNIHIAASSLNAKYILPEIMSQFLAEHKDVKFDLTETDSEGVLDLIVNHSVDIGFVGSYFEKSNCRYYPFYSDELIIVTPNEEKYLEFQNSKDLSWIIKEPFIMREKGSGTRKEMEKFLQQCNVDVEKLNIVANIENTEIIKSSISKGMGISVLSKLTVEQEICSGQVLAVSFPEIDSKRELSFVYNKNYQLSSTAKQFVKKVKTFYEV